MLTEKGSEVNSRDPIAGGYDMYAIKLNTEVYHLVQRGGQNTLCGLRVSRVTSERNGGLYLVESVPESKKICKHCERIRDQDKA
jgi:hypothetical protein